MDVRLESIVLACGEDREIVSKKARFSWIRRCGLDLLLKMTILLANSFGKRKSDYSYLFVDEINNSNMRNNLFRTAQEVKGEQAIFLSFYSRSSKHLKVGRIWSVAAALKLLISSIPAVVGFIGSNDPINHSLARVLVKSMLSYLQRVDSSTILVLMTDHHFFSTVIAMSSVGKTVVLQHGLIQDVRFFSPVRANYLYAWSEKSVNLAADEKALVSGTYKFDVHGYNVGRVACGLQDANNVLVLLSASVLSSQIVDRLAPILILQTKLGFHLGIKTHPGSLFSLEDLKKAVGDNSDIRLYKEERIEDISFDFAFIEQSTAVIDVACLGIPFIIIDDTDNSYFASYAGLLPIAHSEEELLDLSAHFDTRKYIPAYNRLLENEICTGVCRIKEMLASISHDEILRGRGHDE